MKTSIFHVIFNQRSLHEAFRLSSEIGFEAVELWGKEPHISANASIERAKEIKRLADGYGMDIAGVGSYAGRFTQQSDADCEKSLDEVKRYLELMGYMGADLLRVGPGGPHGYLAQDYHYEKAAYWMQRCGDLAKDYNVRIGMEVHGRTIIETTDEAMRLVEMIDRENVGLIHDGGNLFIYTDHEYGAETIKKMGDKLFHVHVKGERFVDDASLPSAHATPTRHGDRIFQQVLLSESEADYSSIFKGLREIGYDGYVSTECFAPLTDIERAKGDLEEMKRLIAMK